MGAVLDLFKVLYEPGAVFERVRDRPRVLVPMVTVVALSIVLGVLAMPFVRSAFADIAARQAEASGGRAPDAGTMAALQIGGSAVFLPIAILLGAGILWIAVSLFGEDANYRKLLSVQTHAMILYIAQVATGLVVLTIQGVESVTSPADLQPPLGLDFVAPGATGYLGAVLKGVNVFSVWGVIVQGIGVTKTHNTSRETGYGAAALAFVVALLVFSLFALFQPSR